jgi:putative ATP-binding cassette transporter
MSRNKKINLAEAEVPPLPADASPGSANSKPDSSASPELTQAAHSGLSSQLGLLRRSLIASHVGKRISGLWILILIVVAANAYAQIRLNAWNKPFYDAISRRDLMDFLYQLGVFGIIAGTLLVLDVSQRWLGETLKYRMREGLVADLIRDWMQPRRAFWLANAGPIGANPDQRMHEDARHLCELSSDLGVGLLRALILLIAFSGILWGLSKDFTIHVGERDYAIPGFMLWAAIIYALIGSLLSYWVGHTLIARNEERYAREADLRFSLVRVNEHVDGISLAAGEADETRRVELHFAAVLAATARLVAGLTNLTWVTAGFGWITNVAPTLVAAPLYFTGKLSFGGLMMAAAAFTQAQSSLRWFIDNFSTIADWRAALLRVATFRRALNATEIVRHVSSTISYVDGPARQLTIDNVEVVSATGCDLIRERHVEVRAGERVLIAGELGTNKTLLFRALAGLWPWGNGRVVRPAGESIYYFPRGTPYLPRGTLREVLAYPTKVDAFAPAAFKRALQRMGLERLEAALDETRRWDRELSADEQLALAFARVMLQAPEWLLIDGALGALDGDTLERVYGMFSDELKSTSIINIVSGSGHTREPLFTRVVHLVKAPRDYAPGAGK